MVDDVDNGLGKPTPEQVKSFEDMFLIRRHRQLPLDNGVPSLMVMRADSEEQVREKFGEFLIKEGMDPSLPYMVCRVGHTTPDFWDKEPL